MWWTKSQKITRFHYDYNILEKYYFAEEPRSEALIFFSLTSGAFDPLFSTPRKLLFAFKKAIISRRFSPDRGVSTTAIRRWIEFYLFVCFIMASFVDHIKLRLLLQVLNSHFPKGVPSLPLRLRWPNTVFKSLFMLWRPFFQELRLITKVFILVFWQGCMLSPWQRGWLKTRL